jgi:hypothetical protein
VLWLFFFLSFIFLGCALAFLFLKLYFSRLCFSFAHSCLRFCFDVAFMLQARLPFSFRGSYARTMKNPQRAFVNTQLNVPIIHH